MGLPELGLWHRLAPGQVRVVSVAPPDPSMLQLKLGPSTSINPLWSLVGPR